MHAMACIVLLWARLVQAVYQYSLILPLFMPEAWLSMPQAGGRKIVSKHVVAQHCQAAHRPAHQKDQLWAAVYCVFLCEPCLLVSTLLVLCFVPHKRVHSQGSIPGASGSCLGSALEHNVPF